MMICEHKKMSDPCQESNSIMLLKHNIFLQVNFKRTGMHTEITLVGFVGKKVKHQTEYLKAPSSIPS